MPSSRFQTRCAVLTSIIVGCILCGCEAPKATQFKVSVRRGIFADELVLKSEQQGTFENVDVTITVVREAGVTKLERHWAYWKPDEEKVIEIPHAGGSLQRTELSGYGNVSDRRYHLEGKWLWDTPKD